MSIIVNGVELTEAIYAGVNHDIVKVKKGTAEAVTVFEKITQLEGTWVFNDTVDVIPSMVSVNFIDLNKKQFNGISPSGITMYYGFLNDSGIQDGLMAYGGSGWRDTAYKTITITSKLSEVTDGDTLLTWLRANATKQ